MSRMITAITIFLTVIGLSICESVYTINVSEDVKSVLNSSVEAYNDGDEENAMESIKEAKEVWDKNSAFLEAFLIHDNIEEIAEKITIAEKTLKYDHEHFPIECEGAIASLKVMIYSMLPYVDNIL